MDQNNNQQNNGPMGMPPMQNQQMNAPMASARTNTMAILSLVFAFIFSPLGIVFGAIGLNQIKKTGEEGKGLALAGLITSLVFTILWVIYAVIMILAMIATASTASQLLENIPETPYSNIRQ
jgi:peptidyl-prolyl cis-trans isomerase B (cyclophilin B)